MVRILTVLTVFATALLLHIPQASAQEMPGAQAPAKPFVYAAKPSDITRGKSDAPVIMVEYGSLTCPHCAHFFSDVLPGITSKYIDTGKVFFVFRNYLRNEVDLRGAMMVQCADPLRREAFLKVLFTTQSKWAFDANYRDSLASIAALGGMDRPRFEACMNDKTVENLALAVGKEGADDYKINSTPTFFINGVTPPNNNTESINQTIDAALAKAAKK